MSFRYVYRPDCVQEYSTIKRFCKLPRLFLSQNLDGLSVVLAFFDAPVMNVSAFMIYVTV